MSNRVTQSALAGILLGSALFMAAPSQGEEKAPPTARAAPKARPLRDGDWHARRGPSFQRNWGVDIVGVRRVSSGLMLRFDYRVLDPEKAAVLADRKARPYLIDEATGAALAVPTMENIGELRQTAPLEVTRRYFMIFGNPGGLVKHGGRVTLVAGPLRAEGLEVD